MNESRGGGWYTGGGARGAAEIERIYWHILFYEFIELDLIGLGQWKLRARAGNVCLMAS